MLTPDRISASPWVDDGFLLPPCSSNIAGTLRNAFPAALSDLISLPTTLFLSSLSVLYPSSSLSPVWHNLIRPPCRLSNHRLLLLLPKLSSRPFPLAGVSLLPGGPTVYVCVSCCTYKRQVVPGLLLLPWIQEPHFLPFGHKRPQGPPLPLLPTWSSCFQFHHHLPLDAFSSFCPLSLDNTQLPSQTANSQEGRPITSRRRAPTLTGQ